MNKTKDMKVYDVHQIWMQGWDSRPRFAREYAESWKEQHPRATVWHWDECSLLENFGKLLTEKERRALDSYPLIIQKADLWRMIVLKHMGGVYTDLDFVCLDNLDEYLSDRTFVASVEHDGIIANGFIACTPFHPVILAIIDYLTTTACKRIEDKMDSIEEKAFVLQTTGPHAVSKVIYKKRAELTCTDEVRQVYIEKNVSRFFPMKFSEYNVFQEYKSVSDLHRMYPNSYAVHVYWGSWTYNKELFF